MLGLKDIVREEIENDMKTSMPGIMFVPFLEEADLLHPYIFSPGEYPTPLPEGLAHFRGDHPAVADIATLKKTKTSKKLSDYTLEKPQICSDSQLGLTAKTPSLLGGAKGKANATKMHQFQVHVHICELETTFFDYEKIQKTGVFIGGFAMKHAVELAKLDTSVITALDVSPRKTRADVILGFMGKKWTGKYERCEIRQEDSGKLGMGGGAQGVTLDATASKKQGHEFGHTGYGIVVANFSVVHLRKNLGSEVQLISPRALNVTSFNGKEFRSMLKSAYPRKRFLQKVLRGCHQRIFRLGGAEEAGRSDPPEVKTQEDTAGGDVEMLAADPPEDGMQLVMLSSSSPPTALFDEDNIRDDDLKTWHSGSWNLEVLIAEAEVRRMVNDLHESGSTTYKNLTVNALAIVHCYSDSNSLPIFFNKDSYLENRDEGDRPMVPSHVLYYGATEGDHSTLCPVENVGENNLVVTMFDQVWKVQESVLRVRQQDTDLLAKFSQFGFHELRKGQESYDDIDGSVLMGRHELVHVNDPGTDIPDVEFVDGYIRSTALASNLSEEATVYASAAIQTDVGPPGSRRVVTDRSASMATPPRNKKAKMDDAQRNI